tara:strand:+ start:1417 stop:1578 length:162 start_codon:yes stop_codon:yes gene_type:complete
MSPSAAKAVELSRKIKVVVVNEVAMKKMRHLNQIILVLFVCDFLVLIKLTKKV